MNIHCKLSCYVCYTSLLTYFYKYPKYKSVEMGYQLEHTLQPGICKHPEYCCNQNIF